MAALAALAAPKMKVQGQNWVHEQAVKVGVIRREM